jgi:hypothetical protein
MKFQNRRFELWRSSCVAPYFANRRHPVYRAAAQNVAAIRVGGIWRDFWSVLDFGRDSYLLTKRPNLRFIARAKRGIGLGFVAKFGWVCYHPNGLIDPFNRLSSAILPGIVFGGAKLNCEATLNRVRRGL